MLSEKQQRLLVKMSIKGKAPITYAEAEDLYSHPTSFWKAVQYLKLNDLINVVNNGSGRKAEYTLSWKGEVFGYLLRGMSDFPPEIRAGGIK